MSYYAKIEGGLVTQVVVSNADAIAKTEGTWVEYKKDGSVRKNPASIGGRYDSENDAFYPNCPYNSWSLNKTTFKYEPPVARPDDGNKYVWNESAICWQKLNQ